MMVPGVAALAACGDVQVPPGGAAPPGGGATSVPLAEVPVGGGTVVQAAGGPVLVTQPQPGTVRAFTAVCPHQGATVSPPEGGIIECAAHGSRFDAATGDVEEGPATTGLAEVGAQLVGDTVQLA